MHIAGVVTMAWDDDRGDAPEAAIRERPPDLRSPIDDGAPVSGHHPPADAPRSAADEPEHDWAAAATRLMPLLRPPGSGGTPLETLDRDHLAAEGLRSHAMPVVDQGPAGLTIAYAIGAGGFDVLVNADHLLAWAIPPERMRAAAMDNLGRWSADATWLEEAEGTRRIVCSDTGAGSDAARILLPEVRQRLTAQLGADGRVLVGLPERHLLLAAVLRADDPEFASLFAEYVAGHADDADEPIDRRVFELVNTQLEAFAP